MQVPDRFQKFCNPNVSKDIFNRSLSYKSRSSLLQLFVLFLLSMLWRSWLRLFLLFFLHPRGIRRSRSGCHCSAVKVGWCCCFLRSLKSLLPAEIKKMEDTKKSMKVLLSRSMSSLVPCFRSNKQQCVVSQLPNASEQHGKHSNPITPPSL